MELKVVEKSKDMLRIEVRDESHTLLNLLRENSWKEGARQVSYSIEHPYMSHPRITVRSKNPKKVLLGAAQMISNQAREFEREFKGSSRA